MDGELGISFDRKKETLVVLQCLPHCPHYDWSRQEAMATVHYPRAAAWALVRRLGRPASLSLK